MNREYAIKKINNKYIILVKTTKTIGSLWWKRTIDVWNRADMFGYPFNFELMAISKVSKEFNMLEDATEQILEWIKEPEYYDVSINNNYSVTATKRNDNGKNI